MLLNEIPIKCENIFVGENRKSVSKLIDKNPRTKWVGGQFPANVQIELEENFCIEKIAIDVPKNSYSLFSVFTSLDGVDFSEACRQESELNSKGRYEFDCKTECRFIRVLVKYNSHSPYVEIKNIELYGQKTNTPSLLIEPDYPESFENSVYNVAVSENDTINEVYNLVSRTVGEKYKSWFEFELCKSDKEFYEISDCNGKIKIKGNRRRTLNNI